MVKMRYESCNHHTKWVLIDLRENHESKTELNIMRKPCDGRGRSGILEGEGSKYYHSRESWVELSESRDHDPFASSFTNLNVIC